MARPLRPLIRSGAFVSKEIAEVLRQPRLVVFLVLAPFVILFVFGIGLVEDDPPLRTIFVAPDDPALVEEVERFAEEQSGRLIVEEVVLDEQAALRELDQGNVELVVSFPDDAEERIRDNQQAEVTLYHNQVDPVETQAVELYTRLAVDELNRQLLASAVDETRDEVGATEALGAGGDEIGDVDAEVLVAPFRGEAEPRGARVAMADFYAPAVVVLLLQQLVVTFLAMSFVREGQLGVHELFRLAPVRPGEVLVGKYVAHALLGAVVTAALVAALVFGLGVPMVGDWALLAGVLGLTLLACAGAGMLVALIARTDSQAVQYAMMLLLATVFLGGFLVSLERFVPGVRWVSWLLPATHGIAGARDVMLRGRVEEPVHLVALGVIAAVLTALSWWLVRRRLRQVPVGRAASSA